MCPRHLWSQNPQKSLPCTGKGGNPRQWPVHAAPKGDRWRRKGRSGGHSEPQCKGIWVCWVKVSSSQNTEAHKACATNTCPSHFQCQPVFPEVFFSEYKSWENFLRGFCGQKALGDTGELLFLENNRAVRSSGPTLCGPSGCTLPGSSVRGIFQERLLAWVASSYSRGSSWPRDWTHISCVSCSWVLYLWFRESQGTFKDGPLLGYFNCSQAAHFSIIGQPLIIRCLALIKNLLWLHTTYRIVWTPSLIVKILSYAALSDKPRWLLPIIYFLAPWSFTFSASLFKKLI